MLFRTSVNIIKPLKCLLICTVSLLKYVVKILESIAKHKWINIWVKLFTFVNIYFMYQVHVKFIHDWKTWRKPSMRLGHSMSNCLSSNFSPCSMFIHLEHLFAVHVFVPVDLIFKWVKLCSCTLLQFGYIYWSDLKTR